MICHDSNDVDLMHSTSVLSIDLMFPKHIDDLICYDLFPRGENAPPAPWAERVRPRVTISPHPVSNAWP